MFDFEINTTQNPLEHHIRAAEAGQLDPMALMQAVLDAQIFLPVRDKYNIGGLQSSDKAELLVIEEEESGLQVVIAFTSPDRARDFLRDFPEYKGGLLTEFHWLLDRLGGGVAVSLNPGLEVGLDIDPETLDGLRHLRASAHADSGAEQE